MTVAVVVGYGSAGRRHVRLLQELGCQVAVVSRRSIDHAPCFPCLRDALLTLPVEYVVVANETSQHAVTVEELLAHGFAGRLLVEKPLGALAAGTLNGTFRLAAVGYNLRFHPILAELAHELRSERLVAMQIYCGQFLPDWRPGTDYRMCYSADATRGGGVLRDLSHELDYLLWLAGDWRRVAALGGRLGTLEIGSDDCWALLLELERCPVATVQVNYLDRPGRRQMVINTTAHTYAADFNRNVLTIDGETRAFEVARDELYLAQHRAALSGDASRLCGFVEADRVMRLIRAAQQAARERRWIAN
jgi:predicted dehydrogenase